MTEERTRSRTEAERAEKRTRATKKKKQKSIVDKLIGGAIAVIATIAIVAWWNGLGPFASPTQDDLSGRYETTERDAKAVQIIGQPEVRSEPIVIGDDNHASNSFGTTKKTDFSVIITKVYGTKEVLDKSNGTFVGLKVDEVLNTAEGKEWFPSSIANDPDGIVWINYKYIKVIE